MDYIKGSKAAENGGLLCGACVCLCAEGKIPGVIRKGTLYMIPENAAKPLEGRKSRAGLLERSKRCASALTLCVRLWWRFSIPSRAIKSSSI